MTAQWKRGFRRVVLLLWPFWLAAASCQAPEPEPLWGEALVSKIDSLAEATLRFGPIGGLSIGVKRGDDLLLARGYGYAGIEDSVPATAETVYRIASITKQFTAAAVMQLVDAGSVAIDDPLTDYLPDYPTRGHRVTIRHLLTHTSGIETYDMSAPWTGMTRSELAHALPRGELLAMFRDSPFLFAPGERWSYSNSGYLLLGMVIEAVSGETYREYVPSHLFEPLGLGSSSYCDNQPRGPMEAKGYRAENRRLAEVTYLSPSNQGPAGALCSTVLDLLAWSSALRTGRIVSLEAYEQMTTPTILENGNEVPYGLGTGLEARKGEPVVSHSGGVRGFVSYMGYYPESDLDLVILANTAHDQVKPFIRAIERWVLDPESESESR